MKRLYELKTSDGFTVEPCDLLKHLGDYIIAKADTICKKVDDSDIQDFIQVVSAYIEFNCTRPYFK